MKKAAASPEVFNFSNRVDHARPKKKKKKKNKKKKYMYIHIFLLQPEDKERVFQGRSLLPKLV